MTRPWLSDGPPDSFWDPPEPSGRSGKGMEFVVTRPVPWVGEPDDFDNMEMEVEVLCEFDCGALWAARMGKVEVELDPAEQAEAEEQWQDQSNDW